MISSGVSRASAAILFAGGLVLLFAPDVVLPRLIAGFPPSAAWLGELLGAGWLGLAAMNWFQRGLMLGGIYGRPVVMANLVAYAITALTLLRAITRAEASAALWIVLAPSVVLATTYGALLLRGPFDPLQERSTV